MAPEDFDPARRKLDQLEIDYLGPTEHPADWPIARSIRSTILTALASRSQPGVSAGSSTRAGLAGRPGGPLAGRERLRPGSGDPRRARGCAGRTLSAHSPRAITIAFPVEPTALGGGMLGLAQQPYPAATSRSSLTPISRPRTPRTRPVPWLAAALPSLDDGTWKVRDDGRMDVTWKLRQGIRWHDGVELTSADLKFGWEIGKDAATQVAPSGVARFVEAVATPDPYTAIFTWTAPSQLGAQAGVREFDVLPRHILDGAERLGLLDHPYFSDPGTFVGSGPYRPVSWDLGSSVTLEAFDDYFLGGPESTESRSW